MIEYATAVKKNTDTTSTKTYNVSGNHLQTIKWCRRNFGERGDGWDFYGTMQGYMVDIWSKKLIVMWELFQE